MRVLIAGGGTGGHLFPGIAIAQEVATRHPKNEVLFVGTARGIEATAVPRAGYALELIEVSGLKGMGLMRMLAGLVLIPRAIWQSRQILKRFQPDVVIGVGGYASGPAVLAAWLGRVPTCVQEQNALPGMTNRVLGWFVDTVFIAFEEARRFFPHPKVRLLGNPIRHELMDNFLRDKIQHERFQILVFGGSQGAHALNTALVAAAPLLGDLKDQIAILHQTGKKDVEAVRQGYATSGLQVEVVEFIVDMSRAYASADLVVCRAGATTIAELTVCKKPAILVPFPYAADNHQEVNARAITEAGAAVMIPESQLSPEKLAGTIRELIGDRERLSKMEKAAGLLGRPEAAREIAEVCVELMQTRWGKDGRPAPPSLPPVS